MDNLPATFNAGQLAPVFTGTGKGDELMAGITAGFAVMSYRGKVWSTKYQGVETPLMRADGDGARASIEVVIVKAATPISKIFYESGYVDGSTSPPDCWSTNGVTPDGAAPKKQSATCAGCPKNAWGSKITDAGKQAKACADSKRLAIVPLGDIENELLGGPMLLRVPAASLKDLKGYGEFMQARGYPYFAVATRVSFDVAEAFPKFVLGAIRPLTEDEGRKVLALRDDPRVQRILNEAVENVHHEPDVQQPDKSPFESGDPAKPVAPAPSAPPVSSPPPAAAPARSAAAAFGSGPDPVQAPVSAPVQTRPAATQTVQATAKPEPKPEPVKPKSKAELLREQLAAAEAEEAQQKAAAASADAAQAQPQAAKANGGGAAPAPAEFEKMLDDLLPK